MSSQVNYTEKLLLAIVGPQVIDAIRPNPSHPARC